MEEEPKHIVAHTDEVTYLADGTIRLSGHLYRTENVSDEEARQMLAESQGVDVEDIKVFPVDEARARRRGSVAFSGNRWNSTWDPKANPNFN